MKRKHLIIIVVTLIIVSVSIIIYKGYNNIFFHNENNSVSDIQIPIIQPYTKLLADKSEAEVTDTDDITFAILGTDERAEEKSRSDVIIVAKYKPEDSKLILVSVPRDSKVSIYDGYISKINSANAYGGPKLQVEVLERLFNVSNMKYVHINFNSFIKIVDELGGIEINSEKDFRRDWGDRKLIAKKGKNILMGEDLLEYVRFRHDSDGDFGRIKRQQEVLKSLYTKVTQVDKITKLPQIAMIVAKNIDSDMNIFYIMKHINMLKNIDEINFEFYTLQTYSDKSNGIWYEIIDEQNLDSISDLLQN